MVSSYPTNDVAIIGMACRFPGANHYEEFWANLRDGVNSVGVVPAERWRTVQGTASDDGNSGDLISNWGAFLDQVGEFDNHFFNISPREAVQMDPQQRLLLEEAWHCIEDAGVGLAALRKGRTAVSVGAMTNDYLQLLLTEGAPIEPFSCLGNYDAILANRISYFLGLRGESKTVSAACASSLVALHDARRILINGEADYAISAGVSVICHPWKHVSFSKSHMLSPSGCCRTFDAGADGYVPGEGVAVVLLQRLEEARRDRNRVYGILKGSAVNHVGDAPSITSPRVDAQREVIQAAWRSAGVSSGSISYIEAHGTGTSLGDPIEIEALRHAFAAEGPSPSRYCAVGSLKTNIGHLEAAAGIAGVIKVLLMMRHGEIPPSLHLEEVNPMIDFDQGPLRPVTTLSEWRVESGETPRRAGVSSFGFGGVSAHAVLEAPIDERVDSTVPATLDAPINDEQDSLFLLSARSPRSLQGLIDAWNKYVNTEAFAHVALRDICHTLAQGREFWEYRSGSVISSKRELVEFLKSEANRLNNDSGDRTNSAGQRSVVLRVGSSLSISSGGIDQLKNEDSAFGVHYSHCLKQLYAAAPGSDAVRLAEFAAIYALARGVISSGITPLYICGEGLGNAVGLAIAGLLPLESAFALAEKETRSEYLEPRPLMFSFYDPISRQVVSPFSVDAAQLGDWITSRSILEDEWSRTVRKARSLIQNQQTFIRLVREWDALLKTDTVRTMLFDDQICSFENPSTTNKRFVLFIILEVCLRSLRQKWQFNSKPIESGGVLPLVELVAGGLLAKEQLVELFLSDSPDLAKIASMINANAIRNPEQASVLTGKLPQNAQLAVCRERDDRWLREIVESKATEAPDFLWNATVLQIGGPGDRSWVDAVVNPNDQNGLRRSLWNALLTLWLKGVPIPWRQWIKGDFHRVALPGYVFDRKSYWVSKGGIGYQNGPSEQLPANQLARRNVAIRQVEKSVTLKCLDSGSTGIAAGFASTGLGANRNVRQKGLSSLQKGPVSLSVQDGVALLRMCDEDHKNAFTHSFVTAFRQRLKEIEEDKGINVVVLTNSGSYFCSGADSALLEGLRARERSFTELACFFRGILECPVPVIHAVAGHAFGGGFAFSLYGDFVFLGKGSYYSANFLKLGFTPGMGATLILPEKLGAGPASRMLFTGEILSGAQLVELGALVRVVDNKEVLPLSLHLASQLAEKPRAALTTLKKQLTRSLLSKLDLVIEEELKGHELTLSQSEAGEASPDSSESVFRNLCAAASAESRESYFVENISERPQAGSFANARKPVSEGAAAKERPEKVLPSDLSALREAIRFQISRLLMLDVTELDEDQSFKELGFDSVLSVEMVKELNRCYGLDLDTAILYEWTTPRKLLDHLVSRPLIRVGQDDGGVPGGDLERSVVSTEDRREPLAAGNEAASPPGDEVKRFSDTDIAVIGMAGRFPGAADLEAFWQNLANGIDSISVVPSERWDYNSYYDPDPNTPGKTYSRWGGFLEGVESFDSLFFKISPREAESIDPQQRVFLEEAWKALEDAGYCERNLRGRRCAVFVGTTAGDYTLRLQEYSVDNTADAFLGSAPSILASRISYTLGLTGASVAIDTACSSSLVAVHQACQSLNVGDCDMALAGGVSVLATPQLHVRAGKARMLSPSGRCRAFSDDADGIVLSEGVGVLVLKPLKMAVADGDFIYGVIRVSGVNQDGRTNGITAPNARSQAELEKSVYERVGLSPESFQLVEAHGTGTRLGDPIEVKALTTAFSHYTSKRQFCALGSVKTNIGHTTTAAGIAGLTKVLLAMKHEKIPPSLHFRKASERIRFEETPFYVNDTIRDWQAGGTVRRAAVSSFGFSGTNCHVVVEDYPRVARPTSPSRQYLFLLSAKTRERLRAYAQKWISFLDGAEGARHSLIDIAYTLQTGREAMTERLAAVIAGYAELRTALAAFLTGNAGDQIFLTGRATDSFSTTTNAPIVSAGSYPGREEWLRLAQYWCAGGEVSWESSYVSERPQRVPLPTYPFSRERHWIKPPQEQRSLQTVPTKEIPWSDLNAVLDYLENGEIGVDQALTVIAIEE